VLTVQAKDVNDNNLSAGGATVTITKLSGSGTIGSVTDNSDGTYTGWWVSLTADGVDSLHEPHRKDHRVVADWEEEDLTASLTP